MSPLAGLGQGMWTSNAVDCMFKASCHDLVHDVLAQAIDIQVRVDGFDEKMPDKAFLFIGANLSNPLADFGDLAAFSKNSM